MSDADLPQNHMPSPEVVAASYAEILSHNRKNTGFSIGFGNMLSAMMEEEEANPDLPAVDIYAAVRNGVNQSVVEGNMKGEVQGILHEDLLMRVGIKLVPLGGHSNGESASSEELVPIIDNTALFTDYISQLDHEKVGQDETSLALVTDVISALQRTIAHCYGVKPEDITEEQMQEARQYGEDALRTFLQLDDAFKEAGLDKPAIYERFIADGDSDNYDDQWKRYNTARKYLAAYKTLEDYVTYWGRGVLLEYIATGSMESLAEGKRYAFDGMRDELVQEVDGIIVLTESARTFDFGVEAAHAMLSGIQKTIQEMDEKPDEWFVSDENRKFLEDNAARLNRAISPA